MKNVLIKYAKEHFIGFAFSLLFGGIVTISLFFFTSSPTSSSDIRHKLVDLIEGKFEDIYPNGKVQITLNTVISQSLDLSPVNSVFTYGTALSKQDENIRFLALFEAANQNILDKLVGRSGFYKLKSFTYIEVPYSNNLLPDDVQISDIDLDGNKDIFIYIKSTWADSVSTGIILLKKGIDEQWKFMSIPSLSARLESFIAGEPQHPDGLSPGASPTVWFGDTERHDTDTEKLKDKYSKYRIYEDEWVAVHNGEERNFVTLRNGGKITLMEHPYVNHKHIGIGAYVSDEFAVQDYHHVMVTFYKIGKENLVTDVLWNWGYPLLSITQEDLSVLDMDVFHSVGLSKHVLGETFFGYTEFGRIYDVD